MFATLDDNDYLIANKIDYRLHSPQRGDIIILRPPSDNSKDFIKRIIALPGERILISHGIVYINGHKLDEPYLPEAWTQLDTWGGPDGTVVPPNAYFVMGDNPQPALDVLALPEQQLRVGKPERHAVGGLQVEPQPPFCELLRAMQLILCQVLLAQPVHLGDHCANCLHRFLWIHSEIDAQV